MALPIRILLPKMLLRYCRHDESAMAILLLSFCTKLGTSVAFAISIAVATFTWATLIATRIATTWAILILTCHQGWLQISRELETHLNFNLTMVCVLVLICDLMMFFVPLSLVDTFLLE